MTRPWIEPAILDWYSGVEDEDARLGRTAQGRVEALRTRELVQRALAAAADLSDRQAGLDVVDVGGGTGAHARWLAAAGHRVWLIDPVPLHVYRAARIPGVRAELGDARALELPDDRFDIGLALGPLYHLRARDDRVRSLRELARVVRPGRPLLAAAIGRYAVLGEFVLLGEFDPEASRRLQFYLGSGQHPDDEGFPIRHAHLSEELATEATDAGWSDVEVLGLKGPLGAAVNWVPERRADTVVRQAVEHARQLERDPRAIDLSTHLMVTGTAPAGCR